MPSLCVTRHLKNARFLQSAASGLIPSVEPRAGYASLVSQEILARLHLPAERARFRTLSQVGARVSQMAVPTLRATSAEPLFSGSLAFVPITFATARGPVRLAEQDLATAVSFAQLAAPPISRYASQYGPNRVGFAPSTGVFSADVPDGRYNDQTLQSWVNEIVAQNALGSGTCVVVLNPPGVVNTDADPKQGIGGYHSLAQVPYIFVNVLGTNLTIADRGGAYALALSHELAEMVVDPKADLRNPEVCDPCGPNCQPVWIDYFDRTGRYLGSAQRLPPPFPYDFFINGIVRPALATACPAPAAACNYAPP